jgi:hypothetical protein
VEREGELAWEVSMEARREEVGVARLVRERRGEAIDIREMRGRGEQYGELTIYITTVQG